MWRDSNGVIHTIASPVPEKVVGVHVSRVIRESKRRKLRKFQKDLEKLESEFYDIMEQSTLPGEINGYPDFVLFDESASALSDVLSAISRIDLLWRLEAIEALNDIVDEII